MLPHRANLPSGLAVCVDGCGEEYLTRIDTLRSAARLHEVRRSTRSHLLGFRANTVIAGLCAKTARAAPANYMGLRQAIPTSEHNDLRGKFYLN